MENLEKVELQIKAEAFELVAAALFALVGPLVGKPEFQFHLERKAGAESVIASYTFPEGPLNENTHYVGSKRINEALSNQDLCNPTIRR